MSVENEDNAKVAPHLIIIAPNTWNTWSCPVIWNKTLYACLLGGIDQRLLQRKLAVEESRYDSVDASEVFFQLLNRRWFQVDDQNLGSSSLQIIDFRLWRRSRAYSGNNVLEIRNLWERCLKTSKKKSLTNFGSSSKTFTMLWPVFPVAPTMNTVWTSLIAV